MAACTSCSAISKFRLRLNLSVMIDAPAELEEDLVFYWRYQNNFARQALEKPVTSMTSSTSV
jgi:hypothetical protein